MGRLPFRQQTLHDVFFKDTPRGSEVEIRYMYGRVYQDMSCANQMATRPGGVRYMQQSLGPTIQRLNQRLAPEGLVIRPGKTKQTYVLDTVRE